MSEQGKRLQSSVLQSFCIDLDLTLTLQHGVKRPLLSPLSTSSYNICFTAASTQPVWKPLYGQFVEAQPKFANRTAECSLVCITLQAIVLFVLSS